MGQVSEHKVNIAGLDPASEHIPRSVAYAGTQWAYMASGARAVALVETLGCRWPVGEVDEPDFHFCGAPRRSGSYCPTHRSLSRKRMAQ